MANPYLNVYMNNPTVDGTDGTVISINGNYNSPLTIPLDASVNETKKIKLAIRAEAGFETSADTTIADSGDTDDRWKLCLTEEGTFTDSITIPAPIGNANVIFYVQASSDDTESANIDRAVTLAVHSKIRAL